MGLRVSVSPGFGGQSFIFSTLPKLREAWLRIDAAAQVTGRAIRPEVDGGLKTDNIAAIAAAVADTFVAGSAEFGRADWATTIAALHAAADSARQAASVG